MILFFSGTGNSKYVAGFLGDHLDDEVVSLNNILKYHRSFDFTSVKPFVFVAPIYCYRYPLIIENLIQRANLLGSSEVYCLATMGLNSGNADKYLAKIVKEKGMTFKGFQGILMPDNYILSDKMLESKEITYVLKKATPVLKNLVASIAKHKEIQKEDKTAFSFIKSSLLNKEFLKHLPKSKEFTVSSSCIGCTLCEQLCPTNNITMVNNRPVFSTNCLYCFSCLQHCPKKAIDIKGKTENKGRYVCPNYQEKPL